MHPHTRLRSVLLVLAAALVLGLGAPAAGQATTSDPYGPTVPPTEPPGDPTCTIDDAGVEVGGTVTGSIAGVEAGAEVELTLGGESVATLVADAEGNAAFSFVLAEVGALVAVGVTFNVDCGELDPGAVLGEGVDRPGTETGPGASGGSGVLGTGSDAGGGTGSGGSGSGSSSGGLARTGATLLPLVVLALVALAVGAYLRKRSRGRRFAV
ncbi:MAG TPA: hypothetical protein VF228_13645 [Iamia sp.]